MSEADGPKPRRGWWRRARWRGPPCRRFTLLDGMILVAGSAVGTAGILGQWGDQTVEGWVNVADDVSGFLLMLASALLLILRLRGPRPTIRRIARQPGAAGCFAVVAFGVLDHADMLVRVATGHVVPPVHSVGEWIWF